MPKIFRLKTSQVLLHFYNHRHKGGLSGPVCQMKSSLMLDIACDQSYPPPCPLSPCHLHTLFFRQGTQHRPDFYTLPPSSTWAGLLCPARSLAGDPYPPASHPQPSPSSLLSLQTPEPAGLSLRTEESDSGSKSQDLHLQYSPVLKNENPRVPTQKEGNCEPKEVLGWRILEEAGQEGGQGWETKSRVGGGGGSWEGQGLQRAQAST